MTEVVVTKEYQTFIEDIKARILNSRYKAARSLNQELVLLYHHIGDQLIEKQKSQKWGDKVLETMSRDLKLAFPEMKGFSTRNLKYMRKFAEKFSNNSIGQQAAAQLPWFHIVILLTKVKDEAERLFYIKKALECGWSRSILEAQIETKLFERQGKAVTNFKERLAPSQTDLAIETLKDPYNFDFLSLGKEAHEREIEKELTKHIERFLLELGAGFAFVGRQIKLEVDEQDFFIDLLFYHLKLRCYVVIELKSTQFKPEYAGQLNFYLSAVDDLFRHETDHQSIGLILCKNKNKVVAEYALKDINKPIGIAEYRLSDALPEHIKTELPSIEELEFELSKYQALLNNSNS